MSNRGLRHRRPEARRDEILRAAAQLLADRGGSVSMESVAGAAGTAKGTIYRYFRSRAELMAALREEYSASLATVARAALLEGASASAADRWARFAESLLDFSLANRALHHALFRDEPVTEDRSMEPLRAALRDFLDQQIQSGVLHLPRPEPLLRVLLDGFHGALIAVAHADRREDDDPRGDFLTVARLVGDALLARSGRSPAPPA